jgi:hypothetical protein
MASRSCGIGVGFRCNAGLGIGIGLVDGVTTEALLVVVGDEGVVLMVLPVVEQEVPSARGEVGTPSPPAISDGFGSVTDVSFVAMASVIVIKRVG